MRSCTVQCTEGYPHAEQTVPQVYRNHELHTVDHGRTMWQKCEQYLLSFQLRYFLQLAAFPSTHNRLLPPLPTPKKCVRGSAGPWRILTLMWNYINCFWFIFLWNTNPDSLTMYLYQHPSPWKHLSIINYITIEPQSENCSRPLLQ